MTAVFKLYGIPLALLLFSAGFVTPKPATGTGGFVGTEAFKG